MTDDKFMDQVLLEILEEIPKNTSGETPGKFSRTTSGNRAGTPEKILGRNSSRTKTPSSSKKKYSTYKNDIVSKLVPRPQPPPVPNTDPAPDKWLCPRAEELFGNTCGNYTSYDCKYCCCCGFPRKPEYIWNSKMFRLDIRNQWPSTDSRLALLIKSGDVAGIQWMIQKGWPINFKVVDSDGSVYDVIDLAEQVNKTEVLHFFRTLQETGPPRQKITLIYQNKPADFVLANSAEDWELLKKEVEEHFEIKNFKVLSSQSGLEEIPLEWFELKPDREYHICVK